jgi:hypothetical protein
MKICFLFRGENERNNSRGYMNSCYNIENWSKTLFDDVRTAGHTYDIVFNTYASNCLEMLTSLLLPKYVELHPSISQPANCKTVAKWIREHSDEYDRFVIIRFDILYRIPITQWPQWNSTGIILVSRDKHWYDERICADFIFIADKEYVQHLAKGLEYTRRQAHQVSQYLYRNDVPFHLMYSEFYGLQNHPLYMVKGLEPDPILDSKFSSIPFSETDVLECSKTYSSIIKNNNGYPNTEHCRIKLYSQESIVGKLPEICYLYTVFQWISFESPFIEKVRKIHTAKRFLYETDKEPTFTLDVDTFSLTEQEKSDFTPRDS